MSTINSPYPQSQRATPPRQAHPSARFPYPTPQVHAAQRRTREPVFTWKLWLAVFLLLFLASLPVIMLGGLYTYYIATGRAFSGVSVGPFQARNLTQAQIAGMLDSGWNQKKSIFFTDGERSWAVTPAEAGLQIDAQASAARAFAIGRGPGALKELFWLARFGKITVSPVVAFDPHAARANLESLAEQINTPARDATLSFDNGQWVEVPGQPGRALDVGDSLKVIAIAIQQETVFHGEALHVITRPVAPRVTDLTPVIDQLRAALALPLTIQAYDPINDETIPVDIPNEEFSRWITVEPREGSFTIRLDADQVSAYLERWKTTLGGERTLEPFTLPADLTKVWQDAQPITLAVRHNPTQYTVEPGDTLVEIAYQVGMPYWKIEQANPGIDPDRLRSGQVLTIPSKNEMLPLPVVPNKRIVISISQQHMWTYENGAMRNEYVISTGIDRSPTIPGVYQIRTHELNAYASVWDLTMPHFMGIYEGWPGFMNGIHGLPTLSSGRLLWAGNLGHKVSYGCIILGLQEAEDLYSWAEEGVVVEIKP